VLIHAAGGGVGLAAIQIAKALGSPMVIATANSPRKREIAKLYGADHVVNTDDADWVEQVRQITPGQRGVDVVLDPLGLISQSLKIIAWNGRLVVIGFAAGKIEQIATNRVLLKNVSISGLFWGMYEEKEAGTVVKVWDEILAMIAKGGVKPMVYTEQQFSGLENAPRALKLLEKGEAWGKVVVGVQGNEGSKL
jgi:NADPH:quinone reductase